MRKVGMSLALALVVLMSVAGVAGASGKHVNVPAETCNPGGGHMVQLATTSGLWETGDTGTTMDVWVAEQYAGSVACNVFQAVARISARIYLSQGEPQQHWYIGLAYSNGSTLNGWSWDGFGRTPAWGQGFWYNYGPLSGYEGCPVGQIYAYSNVVETTGDGADASDGGVTAGGSPLQWVC